jgi:hypothetical protein
VEPLAAFRISRIDQKRPGTAVLYYSWPIMGVCLVGSIWLLGSHRLITGLAMLALSAFAACYGSAVAAN